MSSACRGVTSAGIAVVVVSLLGLAWGTAAGALESLNNSAACGAMVAADLAKLEMELAPAAGASVPAGMPLTFSARSEVPLTFLVASTPIVLPLREAYGPSSSTRTPDIDTGMGTPQPSASGPPTYTFMSLNAGVIPRVLHWEVSFARAAVARCEPLSSQPNETYQTQPRTLTVLASPVPTPTPARVPPPAPARPAGGVAVRVLGRVGVRRNVHLSFGPVGALPAGGYYYAVLVLEPGRRYTTRVAPRCATSSDMLRTDYGYLHPGVPVALTLTPASSPAGGWCPHATYLGGIYAVPHAPPCESRYPCGSEPYRAPSPCWELKTGQRVCGKVRTPRRWSYPDGLPRPLAPGARIIARFHIQF